MTRLPAFTMTVDGDVICCVDLKRGLSITNGVEEMVDDIAKMFAPERFVVMRIIYRDTEDMWDGIATRKGKFYEFVPLRTTDHMRALALARAGIDLHGRDWPK